MLKTSDNFPDYKATMDKYARARGMNHAEVIERAARQANFKMVASENRGGVRRAKMGMFPLNATADPQKGGSTYKNRFYYAMMSSMGVKKGAGGRVVMRPAAYRAYTRRRSARGAMAAGFLVSAKKLGLRKRGAKSVQPRAGGSASKSSARRPRFGRLKAASINAVNGSYEVGKGTMDKAIGFVLRDMHGWANKLLQQTNSEFEKG